MRTASCSPLFDASRVRAWTCSGIAASLVLSLGCTPIQVWMGGRVRLDKMPIATVAASLSPGPGMTPGEQAPLVVAVTQSDGTVLHTQGAGKGKVRWEDLRVTATVATVNAKGIVSLPADPRLSDGRLPHLSIRIPSHPDVYAELDIPLCYDRAFSSDMSGRPGASGVDGSSGSVGGILDGLGVPPSKLGLPISSSSSHRKWMLRGPPARRAARAPKKAVTAGPLSSELPRSR